MGNPPLGYIKRKDAGVTLTSEVTLAQI